MHTCRLVELAALTVSHAREFIRDTDQVSPRGIEQYWTASKSRLDRWSRDLKAYNTQIQTSRGPTRSKQWSQIRPILEEILTGEILTRVWTGVSMAHDRLHGANVIEPIARSVLIGHLEARNRTLNLIVYGRGFGVEEAVELNQLRRRCERWTDMLLGFLMDEHDMSELTFDVDRARDFAGDMSDQRRRKPNDYSWQLVLTSLRAAFGHGLSAESPSAELNEQIASAVLRCFDADLFDSTGLMKSTWLARMSRTANDTQGMIDLLLAEEAPSTSSRF